MNTKNLLVSVLLLLSISVFGQQDVTKDYDSLQSLNQKFVDYQKLKLKISEENEILKQLIKKHLPDSQNNYEVKIYQKSISDKGELLKKMNNDYHMYTDRAMRKMFTQYQSVLSGSGLQKGQFVA